MKRKLNVGMMLIALALVFSLTSCSEDDEVSGVKEILTSKTWNFNKIEAPSASAETQSMVQFVAIFYTGATMSFTDGGAFTMTVLGEAGTGTYSLSSDEKKITITGTDDTGATESFTYDIVNVTSSEVSYKETVVDETETYDLYYYWK